MSSNQSNSSIMPESVSRTLGLDAQRNNILAAKIVADILKTTLGPKGMDKMLVDSSGNITVTNDGVTILEEMEIDHPAAKMMVEVAKTQELEIGDGTTTATVIAGKLLENAEKLIEKKIHPTAIIKGYRLAATRALSILEEIAVVIEDKKTLNQIAMTAMTGKEAEGNKEKLAEIIVGAVEQVASGKIVDQEDIKIEKVREEGTHKSELIHGVVLNKERVNTDMPSKVNNAKILLLDFPLEIKSPESETRISVSTPEQLERFIESEEQYLKQLTTIIVASGANVVFCQKGIDDLTQYYLAKEKILACRRIPKSDMEKLSRATSAKRISNPHEISPEQLGSAALVEEIKKGEDSLMFVRGCKNPKAVTILIRGSTIHSMDEIERAVKDGLGDVIAAIKSDKIVAGGGAVEIEVARRLRNFARTIEGREQLAIEEFAAALETIPEALAENAGLDPIDILAELKRLHEKGLSNHGLNLFTDKIEDTILSGIVEPLKIKTQAITAATEFATMILRIDDVLISKSKSPQDFSPTLSED
ncbi:MAG: thermosome subunit alpha [Nanoarchaeota archaeon]|nr:thermosome subunit alpha [Nanoarchaeota archaeon]